eukprot:TRINITY_DN54297_c1_g1_i2.p1 TRINITY_DN54297_c1_g1~~TRINITY_DN54297_c1_g1_i2.p1  ORF type:complete len:700 (-),score=93.85 TRINITY_DN54297_c1_g1_i2:69-2168(-)
MTDTPAQQPAQQPSPSDNNKEFHRLLLLATAANCDDRVEGEGKPKQQKEGVVNTLPEAPPTTSPTTGGQEGQPPVRSPTPEAPEDDETKDRANRNKTRTHRFFMNEGIGNLENQEEMLNNLFSENIKRGRGHLSDKSVSILKEWFLKHVSQPYPTATEKDLLCRQTGLTRTQVCNWFTNTRKRQWAQVREMDDDTRAVHHEKSGVKTRHRVTTEGAPSPSSFPPASTSSSSSSTTTTTTTTAGTDPTQKNETDDDPGGKKTERQLVEEFQAAERERALAGTKNYPPRRFNKHSWEQVAGANAEEEYNRLKLLLSPVPGSNTPFARPNITGHGYGLPADRHFLHPRVISRYREATKLKPTNRTVNSTDGDGDEKDAETEQRAPSPPPDANGIDNEDWDDEDIENGDAVKPANRRGRRINAAKPMLSGEGRRPQPLGRAMYAMLNANITKDGPPSANVHMLPLVQPPSETDMQDDDPTTHPPEKKRRLNPPTTAEDDKEASIGAEKQDDRTPPSSPPAPGSPATPQPNAGLSPTGLPLSQPGSPLGFLPRLHPHVVRGLCKAGYTHHGTQSRLPSPHAQPHTHTQPPSGYAAVGVNPQLLTPQLRPPTGLAGVVPPAPGMVPGTGARPMFFVSPQPYTNRPFSYAPQPTLQSNAVPPGLAQSAALPPGVHEQVGAPPVGYPYVPPLPTGLPTPAPAPPAPT